MNSLLLLGLACTGTDVARACGGDADGDGLEDCMEEDEFGTDPTLADSDGDGFDDGDELDCGSNPLDLDEQCYACGWRHDDPDDLSSTGAEVGDVVDNVTFVDQCGDEVDLWDFARSYHILFMTAAW